MVRWITVHNGLWANDQTITGDATFGRNVRIKAPRLRGASPGLLQPHKIVLKAILVVQERPKSEVGRISMWARSG